VGCGCREDGTDDTRGGGCGSRQEKGKASVQGAHYRWRKTVSGQGHTYTHTLCHSHTLGHSLIGQLDTCMQPLTLHHSSCIWHQHGSLYGKGRHMHARTHTHTQTQTHTRTYAHVRGVRTDMQAHAHTRTYVHTHTHTHITHPWTRMHTHALTHPLAIATGALSVCGSGSSVATTSASSHVTPMAIQRTQPL